MFQVRYWRASESYYQAYDIDANRMNHMQVSGLQPNVLYNLRVLGYSLGGEGLASSPIIQFILGRLHPGVSRARFLSLAQRKLRLRLANHKPGYFSNHACG